MLKVTLVACAAACVSAGGTAFWFNSSGSQSAHAWSANAKSGPSIHEMQTNAVNLPVQEIENPL